MRVTVARTDSGEVAAIGLRRDLGRRCALPRVDLGLTLFGPGRAGAVCALGRLMA